MNDQTEFGNKLAEIRKNAIIEVSNWGGLGKYAGSDGIIVTNDKSIYVYQIYYNFVKSKELDKNSIDKQDLTEEEFSKIIKFIDDEIANKELESTMMCDAGYKVKINYKGIIKEIKNNSEIYTKAKEIINSLLEK